MMQHVRRRIAKLLPATPEISIPVSTLVETGVESLTAVTLRWGTVLSAVAVMGAHVWPASLPARVLAAALAAAAMDRSGVTHIKVRRAL